MMLNFEIIPSGGNDLDLFLFCRILPSAADLVWRHRWHCCHCSDYDGHHPLPKKSEETSR